METTLKQLLDQKEKKEILAVKSTETVSYCIEQMNKYKVGSILVIDQDKLVGIFTERDVLAKVAAKGIDGAATQVNQVMTKNPLTVSPHMSVKQAMFLITEKRFRHLPVVEEGKVLGLISSGDLTHWVVFEQEVEIRDLQNYITGDKY